ncbi:MAG: hypothetical protein EOP84_05125, partial [Verrucomicrobiaceae bacterium]
MIYASGIHDPKWKQLFSRGINPACAKVTNRVWSERTTVPPESVPHTGAPLTTTRLFRILLWAQWRSLVARTRGLNRQSPLLIFVLAGLVLGYVGVGYWLFHAGLNYLYHFPLVGGLLSQRILFLVFGFFFLMLMFSNVIIGYSTLFRNRETLWLLSLPIAHRNVY